jgi:hypothetical protein
VLLYLSLPALARADEAPRLPSLFDPQRHMRVSEVKVGMKGYGLSVFRGTTIERFDVEVVAVLRNFNPKRDVVLIRCAGQNLEHTGAVQGMSGSPIFLRDQAGRERIIGAFAYGWAMAKDPLAGVQPIEYMLELADRVPATPATMPGARAKQSFDVLGAHEMFFSRWTSPADPPALPRGARRLLAPVSASGIPSRVLNRYEKLFHAAGMAPVDGGAAAGEQLNDQIAPGSVVIAPLVVGDAELHANGTCTDVIDGQVIAFGHPFNNEGDIAIPMAAGTAQVVVASLDSSFRIASMGKLRGEFDQDRQAGIAGRFGPSPSMAPLKLRVIRPDGTGETATEFDFQLVRHPRFGPFLAAIAMDAALSSEADLPPYNTIEYSLTTEFENGRTVKIRNVDANVESQGLLFSLASPLMLAAENPFEAVLATKITGELRVRAESREAQILSVQLSRTRYRPGDRVDAFVAYRPFRGDEATMPVAITLPHDLPPGSYTLSIGDWSTYLNEEAQAMPFKFVAEDVNDVFDILQTLADVRHDALYARLTRQQDGVAVGRVAMELLPSSRRQVLLGSPRSNVTSFVTSDVTVIPTRSVMSGSASFTIVVEAPAKVEAGTPRPTTRPG